VRSTQEEHHDQEIESLGGRIFHLPWKKANPISPFIYKKALGKVLRERGPFAAVHSHVGFYSGFVLPTAKKQNIPIRIAHSHNTSSTDRYSIVLGGWEKLMRNSIMGSATHLLACNELSAEWLFGHQWQDDGRVKIVHNAINLADYETLPTDRYIVRERLKFPQKGPLLGHIGRYDAQKNHRFLIEITASLLQQIPEAHLLLIGEGNLLPEIKAFVQEKRIQNNVHFLGVRSDIPYILRSLDLFILPSLYEGLPVVLIEAQAAGTPCLVSDVVSTEADINVGLIEYENLNAGLNQWVKTIKKVLATPEVPWTKRKQALQRERHDIQSITSELKKLYAGKHER